LSKISAVLLAALALAATAALVVGDAAPRWFPDRVHDWLAASALGFVAFAYIAHQAGRHRPAGEWAKACLVAFAFLAWAANQVWPDHAQAVVLNDAAVAAFVVDVLLTMAGWPPVKSGGTASDSDGAEGVRTPSIEA
jgi:hypothetical protein